LDGGWSRLAGRCGHLGGRGGVLRRHHLAPPALARRAVRLRRLLCLRRRAAAVRQLARLDGALAAAGAPGVPPLSSWGRGMVPGRLAWGGPLPCGAGVGRGAADRRRLRLRGLHRLAAPCLRAGPGPRVPPLRGVDSRGLVLAGRRSGQWPCLELVTRSPERT
jgi:hypothetical protein